MPNNIYSVSYIISYLKNMFTQDVFLRSVSVKGEVSGVKYHTNGNVYFTLKEDKTLLPCTMLSWKKASGLKFELKDGQQVVCYGTVVANTYMSRYEMQPANIKLDGKGQVNEALEKLKEELETKGYFSDIYKKPIPKYAKKVGVVTSETGAAIRDIEKEAKDRNPYVQLYLYPAIVQGEKAPKHIANGIRALDSYGVDVIIVGRGGGSTEDLGCFNDRIVADAIFNCDTPIISAVGHEVDNTIADLVADVRVKTPTAAAALAVFDYTEFMDDLIRIKETLTNQMSNKLNAKKLKLENATLRVETINPKRILEKKKERLNRNLEKMNSLMNQCLMSRIHTYEILRQKLLLASPLEKLSAGYAFAQVDGKPLKSVDSVNAGDEVTLNLKDGKIAASVTGVEKKSIFEQ